MMEKHCPEPLDLTRYFSGSLPSRQIELVAEHVDFCPQCQTTLAAMNDETDPLIAVLRSKKTAGEMDNEPSFQAALRQIQQMGDRISNDAFPIPADQIPATIREYRLIERVGQGGMGVVYRAEHSRLKRTVAIKLIAAGSQADAGRIERFKREMEAIGQIDHANVVRATDAGDVDGLHFLVMEMVDGLTIGQIIRRAGPCGVADACEIARQTALGLKAIDGQSLVHRDIKPSNLMMTPSGVVKILDLGLARLNLPSDDDRQLTERGDLLGTFDYMAPEQAEHGSEVTIQADLYSVGCTMFSMLAGHGPFYGDAYDSRLQKIVGHARDIPPRLDEVRRDIPSGLAGLVARLLAKKPTDRFATPAELAESLTPFATGSALPTLYTRATESPTDQADIDSVSYSLTIAASQFKSRKREQGSGATSNRRWAMIPAIGLSLAAIVVGAYFIPSLFQDNSSAKTPVGEPPKTNGSPPISPVGFDQIIDNGDPGYEETGSWIAGTLEGAIGGSYRIGAKGAAVAQWTFSKLSPGRYEVFLTWLPTPERADKAAFRVYDGDALIQSFWVNQRETPRDRIDDSVGWRRLCTTDINSGELVVQLDNRISVGGQLGGVAADAVRVVAADKDED